MFTMDNISKATRRADIYSFAICLWQLYTRVSPYGPLPPYAIMKQVADERKRPEIPWNCPYDYGVLLEQCWKHDPNERIASFDVILTRLESWKAKLS
jgi:hypothetical protein